MHALTLKVPQTTSHAQLKPCLDTRVLPLIVVASKMLEPRCALSLQRLILKLRSPLLNAVMTLTKTLPCIKIKKLFTIILVCALETWKVKLMALLYFITAKTLYSKDGTVSKQTMLTTSVACLMTYILIPMLKVTLFQSPSLLKVRDCSNGV